MRTIEVDDEVYEKIKDLLEAEVTDLKGFIGRKLFIRTVTYHLVGEVRSVIAGMFELSDASWVADSGRFMEAIKNGTLNEVEPVGKCWVRLSAVTDMFPWNHELPKKQK